MYTRHLEQSLAHNMYSYHYVSRMYQTQIKVWTVIRACLMTKTDVTNLPVGHTEARSYLGGKLPSALAPRVVTDS